MIKSFRHRGLKRFYERGDTSQIDGKLRDRIQTILGVLDVSSELEGMNVPTWRLHALRGNYKGYWSVTVRANWRIIFRFEAGNAYDVDFIDYH